MPKTVPGKRPVKATGRRPRRPSPSNEEFLEKAFNLFSERGFERTSIDAITAAAGIAKRTVYARYGDKKSLFEAALQQAIEQWIVPVERLREAECAQLEESLLAIARILVDNILSPKGLRLLRLTNAESGHMPEIGAFTVGRGTEPTIAYLADLFRRHLDKDGKGFPTAEAAAQAFLDLVVGGPANAAAWGVASEPTAIDQRTRYSVQLLLHGLLGSSSADGVVAPAGGLADENLRLKKLLAESLITLDQAREHLACVAGGAVENPDV